VKAVPLSVEAELAGKVKIATIGNTTNVLERMFMMIGPSSLLSPIRCATSYITHDHDGQLPQRNPLCQRLCRLPSLAISIEPQRDNQARAPKVPLTIDTPHSNGKAVRS
jgi:hypothetical protein